MPYKHKADALAYQRAWQAENREKRNAYERERRGKNIEHTRRLSREAARRRYPQVRAQHAEKYALLLQAKAGGCVDCGERDPIVLEFDHVRGEKVAAVSALVTRASTARLLIELAKCDVRCANCHRRATARRAAWRYGAVA